MATATTTYPFADLSDADWEDKAQAVAAAMAKIERAMSRPNGVAPLFPKAPAMERAA